MRRKWSSASLAHDPERGTLVRRAFEDLATGQYTKQEVIARATDRPDCEAGRPHSKARSRSNWPPAANTGYMRLVKDRILHVWEQRQAEAKDRTAEQERRVKVIQQKLDRLDEAFLFAQSIDATGSERQRDRLARN